MQQRGFGLRVADFENTRLVSISSGREHFCGTREDGSVGCWGEHEGDGRSSPPLEGQFVSVSSGARHTCGLRDDGTIVCWGDDSHGQATLVRVRLQNLVVRRGVYSRLSTGGGAQRLCTSTGWDAPVLESATGPDGNFSIGDVPEPPDERLTSISGGFGSRLRVCVTTVRPVCWG